MSKAWKNNHFNSTLCLRKIVNDHSNCTMTGSFFSFRNLLSRVKNLDESFSHTIRVSISFQMSSSRIEIIQVHHWRRDDIVISSFKILLFSSLFCKKVGLIPSFLYSYSLLNYIYYTTTYIQWLFSFTWCCVENFK